MIAGHRGMPKPADFTLTENRVDVWYAALDVDAVRVEALASLLSPAEHERASRFHFARDSRRYTVAHGVLRTLLAGYTGQRPQALEFNYGARGKPTLVGHSDVHFNISHSHEMAVYAFAFKREVGLDVEYIQRTVFNMERFAERCFSRRENKVLQLVPETQQREAFFNCWTRKEAYIKAIGKGLAQPLDQFEVSLKPGEPARLLFVEGQPQEISRWTFHTFRLAEHYIGALAVEGQEWQVRSRDWHDLS